MEVVPGTIALKTITTVIAVTGIANTPNLVPGTIPAATRVAP
ncbi:MAG: hypothetical protein ACAI34_17735 [Verrucomicrobium sp.]|nr:hypothetical protein [Verrucomicrobium sp.]